MAFGRTRLYRIFGFLPLLFLAAPSSQAADATRSREDRMELRSAWDYQPGQGPYRTRPAEAFRSKDLIEMKPVAGEPAPHEAPKNEPEITTFQTRSTFDVGADVSYYHYHESTPPAMRVQGPLGGLTFAYTGAMGRGWVARAEARGTVGSPQYKGSGVKDDVPNYSGELRLTIGREFVGESVALLPYVGVGYRTLLNDLRWLDSGTVWGYERLSQYVFVPIGLQPRAKLPDGSVLRLTAEFDPLVQGWQDSDFHGGNPGWPNVQNKQKAGYGLRGELMFERPRWAFGPFVNYWNVNQSDLDCAQGPTMYVCAYEPHNHTLEYGLSLRYRFYQE